MYKHLNLILIYNYYFERKSSLNEIEILSDEFWKSKRKSCNRNLETMLSIDTYEEKELLNHMWKIEQYIYEQDQKFLVELAKINKYLTI